LDLAIPIFFLENLILNDTKIRSEDNLNIEGAHKLGDKYQIIVKRRNKQDIFQKKLIFQSNITFMCGTNKSVIWEVNSNGFDFTIRFNAFKRVRYMICCPPSLRSKRYLYQECKCRQNGCLVAPSLCKWY